MKKSPNNSDENKKALNSIQKYEDHCKFVKSRINSLLNKRSKSETKFASLLVKANIYFVREDVIGCKGKLFFTDFYIPSLNLNIEIDGKEHKHRIAKDLEKEKLSYETFGNITIRFTNEEVLRMRSMTIKRLKAEINNKFKTDKGGYLNRQKWIDRCDKDRSKRVEELRYVKRRIGYRHNEPLCLTVRKNTFSFLNYEDILVSTDIHASDILSSLNKNKPVNGIHVYYKNKSVQNKIDRKFNEFYSGHLNEIKSQSELVIFVESGCVYKPQNKMTFSFTVHEGDNVLDKQTFSITDDEYPSIMKADILAVKNALEYLIINNEDSQTKIKVITHVQFIANILRDENHRPNPTTNYSTVYSEYKDVRKYFSNINFEWIPKKALK